MRSYLVGALLALCLTGATALPAVAQTTEQLLTPRTFIDVSKRVLPSVVSISVRNPEAQRALDRNASEMEELFRFFNRGGRPFNPERFTRSSGSGFIVSVEGSTAYVLTNYHVIRSSQDDENISLRLGSVSSGTVTSDTAEAQMIDFGKVTTIGYDQLSDLALLKFDLPEGTEVKPLDFADSDHVEVGEWVLALGNPLELNNSVSQGIVSGKGRNLGVDITIERLIQTTAIINPGNSGGPLVNLEGKVVGVNNAIASNNGLWQGVGFAIPANDVRRVFEKLRESGKVERGWLGITMKPLEADPGLVRAYKLESNEGVIVESVLPDSPGAAAGLQAGDVIVSMGGQKVADNEELLRMIAGRSANETVDVEVLRMEDGQVVRLTMKPTLAARPSDRELAQMRPMRLPQEDLRIPESAEADSLGVAFEPSRRPAGLRVVEVAPGSAAEKAGIREGDVIQRLNGRTVRTDREFEAALKLSSDGTHLIMYNRNDSTMYTTIE